MASLVDLGYPGDYLPRSAWLGAPSATPSEHEDAYTDKVGGQPMWVPSLPMPEPNIPTCNICHEQMLLITQLYVPTNDYEWEKMIYVFGCNKVECCLGDGTKDMNGRSFKVIRIVIDPESRGDTSASTTVTSSAPATAASSSSSSAASAIAHTKSPSKPSTGTASSMAPIDDDDEWGAKAKWSDDEDEDTKSPKKKSTVVVASSTTSSPAPSNEWSSGGGGWSDDDTPAAPKKDDDAILSALLAQQSLSRTAAANESAEKSARAEEKRLKAEAKRQAKEQAQQELIKKALEARGEKEDGSDGGDKSAASSSSSSHTPPPPPPPTTKAFRPFYLAWTPEPTTSTSDFTHELRLLKEYEARQLAEGNEGGEGIEESMTSSTEGGGDDDDDADFLERREEDVQIFFDRLERFQQQCLRYYTFCNRLGSTIMKDGPIFMNKKEQLFYETHTFVCQHCAMKKVMELQLMPKLLMELHVDTLNPKDPVLSTQYLRRRVAAPSTAAIERIRGTHIVQC